MRFAAGVFVGAGAAVVALALWVGRKIDLW
jgi:hypothetical protein